jgi:hypothetical protein
MGQESWNNDSNLQSTHMPHKPLDIAGNTIAWVTALSVTCLALAALWFSRYQPIEMDLAMMHYSAFLINEKHLLLYRDIFENNLPGPFLFHALIGKIFGYGAQPIRFLDTCILLGLAALSWKILAPISRVSAVFAPAFFVFVYFSGGTTVTFQRDYIATLPIAAALALLCRTKTSPKHDAALIGALCGLACGFKPNFIVVFPALYWVLLTKIQKAFIEKLQETLIPAGSAFITIFSIPFLWALQHADLKELLALYKTYTPIYVSTRSDLYKYDNLHQQLVDVASMQFSHLVNMGLIAMPGLLWAWRQQRDNPLALARLRYLAIVTFAIAWHEVIAGKFWYAHLLAPYFFAVLCFSLLITPANSAACLPEKTLRLIIALFIACLGIAGGVFVDRQLYNKHYDSENNNIRSKKIARYLKKNMHEGDKVQGLDGSGDGQGSLLLAQATTATRFVEDIPLYLQPDSPVTQGFRREFLDSMKKDPPAFFVYIHNFFHPAGGNRLKEFKELNQFLQQNYEETEVEDGEYTIYKRK